MCKEAYGPQQSHPLIRFWLKNSFKIRGSVDLAIIILKEPIQTRIQVKLKQFSSASHLNVFVVGTGLLRSDTWPNFPHKTFVSVLSDVQCRVAWPFSQKTHLCVMSVEGHDPTCGGDSGAGLYSLDNSGYVQ